MNVLRDFIEGLKVEFSGCAFFVGGYVRDKYLGKSSKDIDIEVFNHNYDQILQKIKNISVIEDVFECGKSFNVIKAKLINGLEIDIAVPRREVSTGTGHRDYVIIPDPNMSLHEASSRRDFTFNAIMERIDGVVVDHHNGVDDLMAKRLRAVGNSFLDDPLRVLRGMQFCGRFNLRVEESTAYLCALISGQVLNMSKERIWTEWEKLFLKAKTPSLGIQFLEDTGSIVLFPELSVLSETPQDPVYHPEGDALNHTKLVLDEGAKIADDESLNNHDRTILMLSCLCHDFGKAMTTIIENGVIRSPGHAQVGVHPISDFLEAIGAPISIRESVITLCENHMALVGGQVSSRQVRKLARKINATSSLSMLRHLIVADHMGRGGASSYPEDVDVMMEKAQDMNISDSVPTPLMQGRDLIVMGMTPGPRFGMILSDVYEQQLDGQIVSLEDAQVYVTEKYKHN